MTKFMTLLAVIVITVGMTLSTPAKSEAGPLRRWFSGQSQDTGYYQQSYERPGLFSGLWQDQGYYNSGNGGGFLRNYFSNYYRVGNVIINGNRWGDLGYQMDHSDLIRW